jgi:hypothetical protein
MFNESRTPISDLRGTLSAGDPLSEFRPLPASDRVTPGVRKHWHEGSKRNDHTLSMAHMRWVIHHTKLDNARICDYFPQGDILMATRRLKEPLREPWYMMPWSHRTVGDRGDRHRCVRPVVLLHGLHRLARNSLDASHETDGRSNGETRGASEHYPEESDSTGDEQDPEPLM